MEFLKKNKIIVVLVVVILVGLGGVFYFMSRSSSSSAPETSQNQTQNVKQLKPEDIGLSLTLSSDKKSIQMNVTKLDGVSTIEYDLTYDAEETDEGQTANVTKGVESSTPIDVKGKPDYSKDITLGTCSGTVRLVCRYDKIKSDIKAVVKVNYTDGSTGSVESSIPYQ